MAGVLLVDVWTDSRGDAQTVEPVQCPDSSSRGQACWSHNAVYGQRYCPYLRWFGDSVNRRQEPRRVAESIRGDHRCHGQGFVFCELGRRNWSAGCWSHSKEPDTSSKEE